MPSILGAFLMSPEEIKKYKKSGHAGKGWVKSKTADDGARKGHHKSGKDGKEKKAKKNKQKEASSNGGHCYTDSDFEGEEVYE